MKMLTWDTQARKKTDEARARTISEMYVVIIAHELLHNRLCVQL